MMIGGDLSSKNRLHRLSSRVNVIYEYVIVIEKREEETEEHKKCKMKQR
jgi:hypothetical protein